MNKFVSYLNGLHNFNAQNQNAYGERNIDSPFYAKTMVPSDICKYIVSSIEEKEPHIIILTGHAGDGKTSIMYQVMDALGGKKGFKEPIYDMVTKEGRLLRCIKDFSELSDEQKLTTLKEVVNYPKEGKFVFMVANTGPLINTFGLLFDEEERDYAQMCLIDAMDSNDGKVKNVVGYNISVVNIAAIDNTKFATAFLDKIIDDELWEDCKGCPNRGHCHICRNIDLIIENKDNVFEFIENYYTWQSEYGTRLTIRSMSEHLAFMITGGEDCSTLEANALHEKLFANLFFGYEGVIPNQLADNVLGVKFAKESRIYLRRLRADEELLIRRNYKNLFGPSLFEIIENMSDTTTMRKEFDDELRRFYLFMGVRDEAQRKNDIEDIFSKQFLPYITVKNSGAKPGKHQKDLVIDALNMIYTGTVVKFSNAIPITMGAEGGITQSVQLIAGELNTGDIELAAESDMFFDKKNWKLVLKVKKKKVSVLTLPLLDHFEELKNGAIATHMDPQLSHGIENLKSRIMELANVDEDDFKMMVMSNTGYEQKSIVIEDGKLELQS